jgi:5'-deoxynucleotidase YfbR-like HD superfamily hydrolase
MNAEQTVMTADMLADTIIKLFACKLHVRKGWLPILDVEGGIIRPGVRKPEMVLAHTGGGMIILRMLRFYEGAFHNLDDYMRTYELFAMHDALVEYLDGDDCGHYLIVDPEERAVYKRAKEQREWEAACSLANDLPQKVGDALLHDVREFHDAETVPARHANDLDKVDPVVTTLVYRAAGNESPVAEFVTNTRGIWHNNWARDMWDVVEARV